MGEENAGNGGMHEERISELTRNIREHRERTGKTAGNPTEVLRTQDRTHARKHTAKVKEDKKEDRAIVEGK